MAIAVALIASSYGYAAVVSRPTSANNAAAARAKNRMATQTATVTVQQTTTNEPEPEPEQTPEQIIKVDNKSSVFTGVISEFGTSDTDRSAQQRAEMIQRQIELSNLPQKDNPNRLVNACNDTLRGCMAEKCGDDFTKCANDSTTIWNQKMSACRAKTQCAAHEYNLFAPEIAADRDMNVRTSEYTKIKQCGNNYNNCIFKQCGATMKNCLAKKDEDNAISACKSIATQCKQQDSGLAARAMEVFADMRIIATEQAKQDEAHLYELRKKMGDICTGLGAMFDERTLDCVYTVNFFAGKDHTLMASKKLHSDKSFQCTPDWFGIDITTFKENAYRLTREQTSASAGALGGGIGMAAGMISSGGLTRAIDTYNAKSKANKAEKELNNLNANPKATNNPPAQSQPQGKPPAENTQTTSTNPTNTNSTPVYGTKNTKKTAENLLINGSNGIQIID